MRSSGDNIDATLQDPDDEQPDMNARVHFLNGMILVEVEGYGYVASIGQWQASPEVVVWPHGDGGELTGINHTIRIEKRP